MKRRLKQLDEKIKQWEDIVLEYPLCTGYKDILNKLKTERNTLAATIGIRK